MMKVVRVKVVVYEDDAEVATRDIGYFEGQDYAVEITTPDGVDVSIGRKVGDPR